MRLKLLIAALAANLLATGAAHAQTDESHPAADFDPASINLAELISCQSQPEQFLDLAMAVQEPLQAVSLGWRPLPRTNMFMTEFALNAPIRVFGQDSAHIAFAGSSVMAIVDLPDPRPLARQLELETAIDTPEKAMFGKEMLSQTHTGNDGIAMVHSAVLSVSNVTSHPGKTLVGCTYSIDPEEEPELASPAPAPANAEPG